MSVASERIIPAGNLRNHDIDNECLHEHGFSVSNEVLDAGEEALEYFDVESNDSEEPKFEEFELEEKVVVAETAKIKCPNCRRDCW